MTKRYTKNTWQNEILSGVEAYNIRDAGDQLLHQDARIALSTPVIQAGTAVSASKMNNLENGLDAVDNAVVTLEDDVTALGVVVGGLSADVTEVEITTQTLRTDVNNLQAVKSRALPEIILLDTETPLTVVNGVGFIRFVVPAWMDSWRIISAHAAVYTASSSGLPTVQVHNLTKALNILSTPITINVGQLNSFTATTQPVINTSNRTVNTGDQLRFDCTVAGTGTRGLVIMLIFEAA